MKNLALILFIVFSYSIQAQEESFYIKKGFVVQGYDVVSYFNNAPTKGNDRYIGTYNGAKFKFSSQSNLDAFNKSPKEYVPQYGGYCAYALAVKGEKVSVDPETYEIRDGKLYLFYNSWGINTLKSWLDESPDNLKEKADVNWKQLNRS